MTDLPPRPRRRRPVRLYRSVTGEYMRNRVLRTIENWRELRDAGEDPGPAPMFRAADVLCVVRDAVSRVSELVQEVEDVLSQHVLEGETDQTQSVRLELNRLLVAALEADQVVVHQTIEARRKPRTRIDREKRDREREALGWGCEPEDLA